MGTVKKKKKGKLWNIYWLEGKKVPESERQKWKKDPRRKVNGTNQ